MKIPTLCKNYKDLMLDLRVYGKIISTPQQSIAEKRDSLFKEFKLCKPFPTLEEERYKLSPSVSLEYKIQYDNQLIFNDNESAIDLSESGTVLKTVSDEKPCEALSNNFRYESQVTDRLRDEIIKKYDLDTGEVFAMGVASTEKKFGSVKFEISNIYDEEEETDSPAEDESVTEEESVAEEVVDEEVKEGSEEIGVDDSSEDVEDSDEEEVDDSDEEDEDLYDEDEYEDLTEDEDSEDDEDYEDEEEDSEDEDLYEDEDEDYEDEGSEEDLEEEDSEDEDEDYEDEDEDYEDEDSYVDITEEDEDEEEVDEDEDLDEEYEDSDEENESVVSSEEPIQTAPKSVAKPKFYVPEIEDDDVDSFIEARQEKPIKQETPVQENTPVARAPSLQAPTDLRSFLRSHPNCKIEEVLKYFSKREVESEILKGRIIKRNGTLRSL